MRVLHVLPALAETLGGPTQVALSSVRGLRALGVDAEIATTDAGIQPLSRKPPEGGSYGGSCDPIDYQGVPVRFFHAAALRLREFIPSLSLCRWIQASVKEYDLLDLHYLYTFSTSVCARAALSHGVPYTVRAMGQLEPWSVRQSPRRKWLYDTFVDRHLLTRAASVQCTASSELESVQRRGIDNGVLVPLGVDPFVPLPEAAAELRSSYNLPSNAKILLYMSRLHKKKRPELVLEALSLLPADVQCLLAGEGDDSYFADLQSLARSLSVADRVQFVGHLSGHAKEVALQGSDVMYLPSFSENFSIAVAEALIRGLPTVISPEVGLASVVRTISPDLVVRCDEAGAVPILRRLLEDRDYHHSVQAACLEVSVNEVSLASASRKLHAEYCRILKMPTVE